MLGCGLVELKIVGMKTAVAQSRAAGQCRHPKDSWPKSFFLCCDGPRKDDEVK